MDFSKSKIKHLIIHEVGNKLRDEKVFLSEILQTVDLELERTLLNFFLKSFLTEKDVFHFSHSSNLDLNEVNSYTKEVFDQNTEKQFISSSQSIAKHLYECSLHPKVARGELIVTQISGITYNNKSIEVIGIFKSESKDSFLKIIKKDSSIKVKSELGVNTSKIEKGCLILNKNSSSGYALLNIDSYNKLTNYWSNKFLNIEFIDNDANKTKQILSFFRNFTDEVLAEKYNKEIKFEFTNNYIDYFQCNETYDQYEAIDKIITNEAIKQDFFQYKEKVKSEFDFDSYDSFDLSKADISREKKKIKNVIKFDTKLELKVLLDKSMGTNNIEKGYDEIRGMHYYKIYFNEEIN